MIPSAPVLSAMALTFLAKSLLLLCDEAATEKLPVSPHSPIATMMAVPSANFDRTEDTVVKRGQEDGSTSLNSEAGINARATCVMWETRVKSGTMSGCLGKILEQNHG